MPNPNKKMPLIEFEPEFITGLKDIFEEKIVFNRLLGLKITVLTPEYVLARIAMRNELALLL